MAAGKPRVSDADASERNPPLAARPPPNKPTFTDAWLADCFVTKHGRELRHIHELGGWHVWAGSHWQRDDTLGAVARMVDWARAVTVKVAKAGRPFEDLQAAKRLEGAPHIFGALKLASSDRRVARAASVFDRDPWALNVTNGTLDLRTGVLRPHNPEDHFRHLAPCAYSHSAQAPRWTEFVSEILDANAEHVAFFRRFLGYCLTGSVRENAMLLAVGDGCNGKSVLTRVLERVLGNALFAPMPPGLLTVKKFERHPTELALLEGRRLVIGTEVPRNCTFDEERLKSLTGGDKVQARRMREDFGGGFLPTHKFILFANHLPRVRDDSDGFWRRLRVLPFNVSFLDRRDNSLDETLYDEADGILTWLVDGCLEWQQNGLGEPAESRAIRETYRTGQDSVGQFIGWLKANDFEAELDRSMLELAWRKFRTETGAAELAYCEILKGLERSGAIRGRNSESRWLDVSACFANLEKRDRELGPAMPASHESPGRPDDW